MVQKKLTEFSIKHPMVVVMISVIVTLVFLGAFPSIKTDTDPVHMLPSDNKTVTLYNSLKSEFKVNDIVALGVQSKDGSSLFTTEGLKKIHNITQDILGIEGIEKVVVLEDIISVSTTFDIVKNDAGELLITPLMKNPPKTQMQAKQILKSLNDNPMLGGKMAARDGSLVGVFIPLQIGQKEQSYALGEKIKVIANKYLGENEKYYFAGLPIAESTFGNEMFIQMAVYAPLAGVVIFLLMLFFFRSIKIVMAPMMLGVMVVIWSMGALIYSGNVIHIMSSMIPIFLLPIAVLNSIHILSKLSDKMKEGIGKKDAINHVMKELFNPMLYTSLTTIVGFTSLATTGIPPVVVFGVTVGFGVFLSWILSMVFIPSYTMLLKEKDLKGFSGETKKSFVIEVVQYFKKLADRSALGVILTAVFIMGVSYVGVTKIIINDNPVRWFKTQHELRQADQVMNKKLAGTYMANLYFKVPVTPAAEAEGESDFDDFAEEETALASIKDPVVINYMNKIGNFLQTVKGADGKPIVGGVTSIVDVLKKIGDVAVGDRSIPDSREKISQYMFLFESGDVKKGKDMWKLITPGDSLTSQMWVYFKSGDNQNMSVLIKALDQFMVKNPLPEFELAGGGKAKLQVSWSGLMAINNVWQAEMVDGMMKALIGSFIIVFFMMVFLFRSVRWAIIAMLPLSITIVFIYGAIGFTGKFYDMPIAILSSLTLGLSVDFAIHFIEHARMYNEKFQDFVVTFSELFNGTAQAIWRNVLVISIGFLPLFFAGLVPYLTVGSFFFMIMLVSGITTLVLMPAILKKFHPWLPGFRAKDISTY